MVELPRHQCLIYESSPSSQLVALAAAARQKLRAHYRCLFLNSPAMVAGFRSYLSAAGVDVADEVRRGALVLSSEQEHLKSGRFDVAFMIEALASGARDACQAGYEGLWATGDMAWEMGNQNNWETLLEYECRLDALLRENPAISGICQYRRDVLPAEAIQTALYTHQAVFVNETLSRLNSFFEQPETLTAGNREARVEAMLRRIHEQNHP